MHLKELAKQNDIKGYDITNLPTDMIFVVLSRGQADVDPPFKLRLFSLVNCIPKIIRHVPFNALYHP